MDNITPGFSYLMFKASDDKTMYVRIDKILTPKIEFAGKIIDDSCGGDSYGIDIANIKINILEPSMFLEFLELINTSKEELKICGGNKQVEFSVIRAQHKANMRLRAAAKEHREQRMQEEQSTNGTYY